MLQAIRTRYVGASNTKGTRIQVKAEAGKRYVDYNYGLNDETNHTEAARQFAEEMGWAGEYVAGFFDGDYIWVSVALRDVCARITDGAPHFTVTK